MARAMAPAMTRRHDCMSCVFMSRLCGFLCEDYVLLCKDYEFSLIYILLCDCCILFLLYALFWKLPISGGIQNRGYIKKLIYSLVIYSLVNQRIY
jgi:hypothetical protein